MSRYLLLVRPAANRVYAAATAALTVAELALLDAGRLGGRLCGLEPVEVAGVGYVGFETDDPLDAEALAELGRASTAYALFERADGDLLRPCSLPSPAVLEDDLLTILKYRGKTNETFTRLLLNATAWAATPQRRRPRVLDPMCGRGTTLSQALSYGWDAAGVDLDDRDVQAYAAFVTGWLKDKRLKHSAENSRVRREHRILGRRFRAELGVSKDAWKAGDHLHLDVVCADTRSAGELHRPGSFDLVVTDAPYGVQHGSRGGPSDDVLRRGPLPLLSEAVPVWADLLRPGGAMGIAFNTLVAPRADLVAVLSRAGLEPLDHGVHRELAHRVDRSIHRDVVVARRPEAG